MNDKEQELKELKAELYDAGKQIQSMNAVIAEIVNKVGLGEEQGVDLQTLMDRIDFLSSLESEAKSEKPQKKK